MRFKFKFHILLIICLFTFGFGIIGSYSAKADIGPGISVAPDYPTEQIKKNGIFNVIFKPNQHYNLILDVANTSNENKTVNISPNTAYTSNSGKITFDKQNVPKDSSRKYDFKSLFNQKEQKVTIPAKSIDKVKFNLKMPSKQYQGVIVGGFYVTVPNNNKSNIKNNIEVKNNFSYSLAAVIHNNKKEAQPKVKLDNVVPSNNNNQMQSKSNIRNIGAGIISGMNVKSEIIKNSNNKVVSESNHNDLSMAPNSSFNYIDTVDNSLSPGKYKVKMNISDSLGHTWNVSKDFKINTREYITHFTKKIPWTLYTLIGIIIILAVIILALVYHQLKNHNKNKKSKNKDKN